MRNAGLPSAKEELEALAREAGGYRGKIPVEHLPATTAAGLESEHAAYMRAAFAEAADEERAERAEAMASGRVNLCGRRVERSLRQGFFLSLMPYPWKLGTFPPEVCGLTHPSRLRVPSHLFEAIPERVDNLEALEVLERKGTRWAPASWSGSGASCRPARSRRSRARTRSIRARDVLRDGHLEGRVEQDRAVHDRRQAVRSGLQRARRDEQDHET